MSKTKIVESIIYLYVPPAMRLTNLLRVQGEDKAIIYQHN